MHLLGDVLTLLAVASLGIFFGAMLTEGFVLVPYWRSLPADAFYSWYRSNDRRLVGFFGPLTWLAALSALASASLSWWTLHPGRWYAVAAAACALVVSLCSLSTSSGPTPAFREVVCRPMNSAPNWIAGPRGIRCATA
jgi:hypothetical protein